MLIATLPPYVRHNRQIASDPLVDALRFNTVMPLADSKLEVLKRLVDLCQGKPLWLDLKARQLRITEFAYLPYAYVRISRKIRVKTPVKVLFKEELATVVQVVDGDKLILESRPNQIVGAGQPINILDPSLHIEGFLTPGDIEYVEAAKSIGLHRYMLSFAESLTDIQELHALDPDAEIVAKIESVRGLDFVVRDYSAVSSFVRLMAARDDLFINMGTRKVSILDAVKLILDADPHAIAASRILTSLEEAETVSMGDISDLHLLHMLGYRAFMLSDGLCFNPQALANALNVFKSYMERA